MRHSYSLNFCFIFFKLGKLLSSTHCFILVCKAAFLDNTFYHRWYKEPTIVELGGWGMVGMGVVVVRAKFLYQKLLTGLLLCCWLIFNSPYPIVVLVRLWVVKSSKNHVPDSGSVSPVPHCHSCANNSAKSEREPTPGSFANSCHRSSLGCTVNRRCCLLLPGQSV